VRRRAHRQDGIQHVQVLRYGAGLLILGFILFSFVWWPIQAERSLVVLKQWESKLSQKKAELDGLQTRYTQLTSLHLLDQWAAKHGPWRSPSANDVILIES